MKANYILNINLKHIPIQSFQNAKNYSKDQLYILSSVIIQSQLKLKHLLPYNRYRTDLIELKKVKVSKNAFPNYF